MRQECSLSVVRSIFLSMENKKPRRPQLLTLLCPTCGERGLLKPILCGMPEESFNYSNFASGGCVVPSANPPDSRCTGCFHDCYRDEVSGFGYGEFSLRMDEPRENNSLSLPGLPD